MTGETELPHVPDLELADHIFILRQPTLKTRHEEASRLLEQAISENQLAPLYLHLKDILLSGFSWDKYEEMKKKNDEELKRLDLKIKDAQENLGEVEISQAAVAKADYLAKLCDKERALDAYNYAFEATGSLGIRIDIVFARIRFGLFYGDADLSRRSIERAQRLIDEGGDWDRRNRLKAYQGLYLMYIRQFSKAATQLLDVLPTFSSTELTSYDKIVIYAAITGVVSLSRLDMKARLVDSPELLEILPSQKEYEDVFALVNSFYTRDYAVFFTSLAAVEQNHLNPNRYLASHARWYVREMRRRAYAQILESYRSLSLTSIANAFGVSTDFIDADLSRLIPSKQLNCVIDRVKGVVETNRPDSKNAQYQSIIRTGDILLNKLQRYQSAVRLSGADA